MLIFELVPSKQQMHDKLYSLTEKLKSVLKSLWFCYGERLSQNYRRSGQQALCSQPFTCCKTATLESKSRTGTRQTILHNFKWLNFLCLSSPSATFALQHGGFEPREWLAAKGLLLAYSLFLNRDVKVIGSEFSNARYQIIFLLKNSMYYSSQHCNRWSN